VGGPVRKSPATPVCCYYSRVKFRALISDLDGTLLDTLQDLADSVNVALARMGLPQHPLEAYRYFVGDGRRLMALRSLPEDKRDEETLESLLAHIGEVYSVHYMDHSQPFPGIPELLDTLTADGVRLSVLSNKPHYYTAPIVAKVLSRWNFEVVAGESPEVPKKPDPTGALRIITQMNLKPEECLYIGDSGVDMQTAVAAGMYPVGVLWGYRTADELRDNGAQVLVQQPTDILQLPGVNGHR
jgi:phosphoglycolate phosphatase